MTSDHGVSSGNTACLELAEEDFPLILAVAVAFAAQGQEIHGSPVAPLILARGHAAPQVSASSNVEVTDVQEEVDAWRLWEAREVKVRQDAVETGKEGAGSTLRRI